MRDRSRRNFVLRPSSPSPLIGVSRLRVAQGCLHEIARDRARPTRKRGTEEDDIPKGQAGLKEDPVVVSVLERRLRERGWSVRKGRVVDVQGERG